MKFGAIGTFDNVSSFWQRLFIVNPLWRKFSSPLLFFEALKVEDWDAIEFLQYKLFWRLRNKWPKIQSQEDMKDLVADATFLMIRKIRAGQYVFTGKNLLGYGYQVLDYYVLNFLRLEKKQEPINEDIIDGLSEPTSIAELRERREWLLAALKKLPQDCQELLYFRYFEEESDRHILEHKLTHLRSVQSIANRRCDCLSLLEQQLLLLDQQKIKEDEI